MTSTTHSDPAELLAARKLLAAERAMRDAAQAMIDIDLDEATQRAKDCWEPSR